MIFDIIKAIHGNIKFCLQTNNEEYYFVDYTAIIKDDQLIFTDPADGLVYNIHRDKLADSSILTYSTDTIPSKIQQEEIFNSSSDFFIINKEARDASNIKFDELVEQSKGYIESFSKDDSKKIKRCVINNNTVDLEKLKVLGAERVITFSQADVRENLDIRQLYWNLVNTKLDEAINEINESIKEADDEEFEKDANLIKDDLIENVDNFRKHMKGLEFYKLFNQWPTLLNPSPFDALGA